MLNDFHPTLRDWFAERFREPTAPQRRGCPAIRAGGHVPVAAADPLNLRGILTPDERVPPMARKKVVVG